MAEVRILSSDLRHLTSAAIDYRFAAGSRSYADLFLCAGFNSSGNLPKMSFSNKPIDHRHPGLVETIHLYQLGDALFQAGGPADEFFGVQFA